MSLFIVTIMVCLTVSFALSQFVRRLGIPTVIGQITAGIVLGYPLIQEVIIREEGRQLIGFLAEFGIIFLLLLAGMEMDFQLFKKEKKDIFLVAFFAAIIPFVMGYATMKLLQYSNIEALVVGASLSLTSEAIKLKELFEFNVIKTKIGNIMVGASLADDFFELTFLSFILLIAHKGTETLASFPFKILAFVGITYLIVKTVPSLANLIKIERTEIEEFSLLLMITFFIASTAILFGLGPIIGAFIAGIIIQFTLSKKEERKMIKDLRVVTFGFIVPFFFINIGMNLDVFGAYFNWSLFLIITFVATTSKIMGSLIATSFTSLSLKQGWLIGWAMNSRGAVELVIAEIARVNGLINMEIYAAIIAMTIFTTFIFPFVLRYSIKKHPRIMSYHRHG